MRCVALWLRRVRRVGHEGVGEVGEAVEQGAVGAVLGGEDQGIAEGGADR